MKGSSSLSSCRLPISLRFTSCLLLCPKLTDAYYSGLGTRPLPLPKWRLHTQGPHTLPSQGTTQLFPLYNDGVWFLLLFILFLFSMVHQKSTIFSNILSSRSSKMFSKCWWNIREFLFNWHLVGKFLAFRIIGSGYFRNKTHPIWYSTWVPVYMHVQLNTCTCTCTVKPKFPFITVAVKLTYHNRYKTVYWSEQWLLFKQLYKDFRRSQAKSSETDILWNSTWDLLVDICTHIHRTWTPPPPRMKSWLLIHNGNFLRQKAVQKIAQKQEVKKFWAKTESETESAQKNVKRS